jgi:hypothetical protein
LHITSAYFTAVYAIKSVVVIIEVVWIGAGRKGMHGNSSGLFVDLKDLEIDIVVYQKICYDRERN